MTAKDAHDDMVERLATLGVATLTECFGRERVQRLDELGLRIDPRTVAEFMVSTVGVDLFRNKELRKFLLESLSPDYLAEHLGVSSNELRDAAVNFNKFRWGRNEKSRKFLRILKLPEDLIEVPAADRTSSKQLEVEGYPLYTYQNWLRKQIVAELQSGNHPRFLLHMPTGSGKTRTSLEALVDYVRSSENSSIAVVWFAHSEELCEQAAQSVEKLWLRHGSEGAQLLKLWGGRPLPDMASEGPVFVVTSFQTAYQFLRTQDDERFSLFAKIRRKCKVLVVDEAHQSTAPTYRQAIELFANRSTKVLGLTATPGRHHIGHDGQETDSLAEFYCNRKITIVDDKGEPLDNPIRFLTDKKILSEVDRFALNSDENLHLTAPETRHITDQLEIPGSVLEKLGRSAARTNLVAAHTRMFVNDEGASVIIFAPSKDNANELASLLVYSGVAARSVTSESTPYARQEAVRQFRKGDLPVLVNFGVLTTGFDAPNINAVIVARPTMSVVLYSQMIGRGLRGAAMGGTERCKIVDIVDNIANMPRVDDAFTYFDSHYPRKETER